jgi:integrase
MTTKRKHRKPETVKVGNIAVKVYRRAKAVKSKLKDGTLVEKDYTVFEVEDFTAGARRLHSFSDHAKAIKEAEKIAAQLSTGQVAAASMTNAQSASYGCSVELIAPTGASLEHAADVYAKCFEILEGDFAVEAARFFKQHRADKIIPRTVPEAVTELVAARKARNKSPRYLSDLESRLNRFAAAFNVEISTVTTGDVQRFLDKLKLQPQTVKNFRTVLHTLFRFAEQRQYIMKHSNPVADTEKVEAENGEVEIYTPAELARLIDAARQHCKPFLPALVIGAFAGLRSSEIERLTFENIRLDRGFIVASAKKRGTPSRRLVPIADSLKAWLAPYAQRKGRVWKGDHEKFYEAQQTVAAATAASEDKANGIAAQEPVKWKHNALRHSFISYRLAILEDDGKVAVEAGNSKATIHAHYKELVDPADARAWFAIAPEQPANVVTLKTEVAQ